MASGHDFAQWALQDLGVLEATETPSAEDAELCLDALNQMIDAWGVERATIYTLLRTTKTLASGTASYTIGSGGSINIVRPVSIYRARLVIDTTASTATEIPQVVYRDDEWAAIAQKSQQSSLSQGIYYDRNWSAGLGLIYPWPIPNVGTTQLVLYTPTALTEFADGTTDYTFPPGYRRAIRKNLALEVSPAFDATPSEELRTQARESFAKIKRANFRPSAVRFDPALIGHGRGGYNVRTDQ